MKKFIPYFIYLLLVLLPVHALGQTTPNITFVSSKNVNDIVNININTNGNSVTIDWGDGKPVSAIDGDNSHALLGTKTIKIYGTIFQLISKNNEVTSIDASNNPELYVLDLTGNNLTSLDVSKNSLLITLFVSKNQISSLDVSKNNSLRYLSCSENNITALDLSTNTLLIELDIASNLISTLDVSKNTNLTKLNCGDNNLTALNVTNLAPLVELNCRANKLTSLDVSKNTKLTTLNCEYNKLQTLDMKNCPDLNYLNCGNNSLTSIDVSGCTKLETLYCGSNSLTSLSLNNAPLLQQLTCSVNLLTALDVDYNVNLNYLDCSYNKLTSLYVSNNTLLATLAITSNQIPNIDVYNKVNLINLYCGDNKLTDLNLIGDTKLIRLYTENNFLKELIFPGTELTSIACDNNRISYLNISNQTKLTSLSCTKNNLTIYGLPVSSITTYTYAPQNKIGIALSTPVGYSVTLTSEATKNGTSTVFTWKTKGGVVLTEGSDYSISNGVTTFLKAQTDSVYCELSNTQFPAFTGSNVLKTTNTKVSALNLQGNGSKNNPFQIATLDDLRTLSESQELWKYNFVQIADIDATDTKNWNKGKGFSSIGTRVKDKYFFGSYDGQYHTISNLYINHPDIVGSNDDSYGLFGANGGTIKNLGVKDADVTAMGLDVGILAGFSLGKVANCYTSGKVSGYTYAGGLIGYNYFYASLEQSYSLASVSGSQMVGGLVGANSNIITNCYSRGDVVSTFNSDYGGFTGVNDGTISYCYSTTRVPTGSYSFGGFSGMTGAQITASFWDVTTSQQTAATGSGNPISVTGKTTAEMKTQATFTSAGWDFKGETTNGSNDIWTIYSGINDGYPCFVWQTPLTRVFTRSATDTLSAHTATANGFISEFGKDAPTSYGLCWNTTGNPTIADSKVDKGTASVTGKFSAAMTGLNSNTKYYVRAFAQNSVGLSYGEVYSFTTEIALPQLSVTDPTLTTSKVYDGTTTAQVTAGALSGMANGEVVTVTASATYDDANVGTGKTITVSYTLGGADAGNYSAPDNFIITTGQITAKPLTINGTNVTLRKLYDGTTNAIVSETGTLSGVIAADIANVTVSATATYADALVGTGKSITVRYTLGGSATGNYLTPGNAVFSGGEIADKITLANLQSPEASCGGSGVSLFYNVITGTPSEYQVIFSDIALNAGFVNTGYITLPAISAANSISIEIPSGIKAGKYDASLQMRNSYGEASDSYPFTVTVNLSSDYVVTKFNDVVLCDNNSKQFVSYQWFKNGTAIQGATSQYYNDKSGLVGTYYVQVVTTSGTTLQTCPQTLNKTLSAKVNVVAYPSSLKINQSFKVDIENCNSADLQGAVLTICSMQGNRVYSLTELTERNTLTSPSTAGIYIGHIVTAKGENLTFKIVVTN